MLGLLPVILTFAGAYMLAKLRFFFILHPIAMLRKTARSVKDLDTAKSLALALAGTLGVGNIFGVCLGIIIGGAGSVFWLIISSIFSSVLKYCEVTLSSDRSLSAVDKKYGMISTLASLKGRGGRGLSYIYAVACLSLSLVMGSALQCGTVSETVSEIFDTPPVIVGIIFAFLVLLSIMRGVKIIEKITLIAMPLSTIVYIIITLSIVVIRIERLPDVISLIFTSAFSRRSGVGAFLGLIFSPAVCEGYSRGILSNEAGCGTSSFAHMRGGILNPASAGLMGIIEVVFDTVILCSLTALAVLTAVPNYASYNEGMSLIVEAVGSTLGDGYLFVLFILVFLFAYSTVVCWYYYGSVSFSYLMRGRFGILFLPFYLIAVFLGSVIDNRLLVALTDASLLVLSACTVYAIIKKSDRVVTLSELGGTLAPRKFIRSVSLRGREKRASRASLTAHRQKQPR